MNPLGALTKGLGEKIGSLVEILQETLDTLKAIKESNEKIVEKLDALNENKKSVDENLETH